MGKPIGSILVYLYTDQVNDLTNQLPNKARVVISEDAQANLIIREYNYAGTALGSLIREDSEPGTIIAWGDGCNDYDSLRYLVGELNNRLAKNSRLLDRHSSPHIVGPPSGLQYRNPEGPPSEGESRKAQVNLTDGESYYLPADEQGDYKYLTWESEAELNMFQINKVLDLIHIMTGLPSTAFGLAPGGSTSGLSLERQMFAAMAKVRRWQRDIELALEILDINDVVWPQDPFASYMELVTQSVQLVGSNIISAEEARSQLGYEGPAPEPRPTELPGENGTGGTGMRPTPFEQNRESERQSS